MAHGHKKTLCIECGTVIGQCRCMAEDKTITYEICNKCKAEDEGVTMIPSEKQLLREAIAREVYLRSQIKQLEEKVQQLEKEDAK